VKVFPTVPGPAPWVEMQHEIYAAKIGANDDISTIKWEAITTNSSHRNIRPIVVANEGYKVLLWLHGEWSTYKNYDVDVVGKILSRDNDL